MKNSLLQRLLSVILCVSILLGASFSRPQKAEAFAVSASVVASVAAIMTACGVSYWAASQTDAIDYLGGKIDAYLGSLETVPQSYEDWLGIDAASQLFEVTANGTMRFASGVANKILGFVRSFASSEDLTAGGDAVGNGYVARTAFQPYYQAVSGGVPQGTVTASWVGDNTLRIDFNSYGTSSGSGFLRLSAGALNAGYYGAKVVSVSDGLPFEQYLLGIVDDTGYGRFSNSKDLRAGVSGKVGPVSDSLLREHTLDFILSFGLSSNYALASGFCVFQLSGDIWYTAPTAAFTPASDFAVPSDLASDDDTFDVAPNVPLTQGMSVEDASEAVLDGVASEDGLTSEGEAVEGVVSGWGWLSDILSSIRDFVAGIAQTVLGIPQAISQGASDVITGIVSGVQQVLIDVFVPDEAFIGEFVASLYATFDNRFSILSYPFSILGEFITRASGIGSPEPILRWPDIFEPFSHQKLISAGSYNLNSIKSNQSFNTIYDLYMLILKGYLSFDFLTFLYLWFCDVFRMREDDFDNPYDIYLASKEAGEE